MPADYLQLVADLVPDQDAGLALDVRERAIESAHLRYGSDFPEIVDVPADIPAHHWLPVAQYAAYLLCQQLATRYSGERETAVGADAARTESRARSYASRAREYRAAYFAGTGQPDPFKQADLGAGLAPSSAVASWPGRRRAVLMRGAL